MVGAVTYPLLQAARRNGWCKFVDAHPRGFHESLLSLRSSHLALPQLASERSPTASPYYLSSPQMSEDEADESDEEVVQPALPPPEHVTDDDRGRR